MLTVRCLGQVHGFGNLALGRSNWPSADSNSPSATGLRVSSVVYVARTYGDCALKGLKLENLASRAYTRPASNVCVAVRSSAPVVN